MLQQPLTPVPRDHFSGHRHLASGGSNGTPDLRTLLEEHRVGIEEIDGRYAGSFADNTALGAVESTDIIDLQVAFVVSPAKFWWYDATSTAAASASAIVPADNPTAGRWVPVGVGPTGQGSFTTLTAQFTQPAVSANVTVAVVSSAWAAQGQTVFVAGGGHYAVSSIPDSTHLQIQNLGYADNASPAATVPTSGAVVPAGVQGAPGITEYFVALRTVSGQPPVFGGVMLYRAKGAKTLVLEFVPTATWAADAVNVTTFTVQKQNGATVTTLATLTSAAGFTAGTPVAVSLSSGALVAGDIVTVAAATTGGTGAVDLDGSFEATVS